MNETEFVIEPGRQDIVIRRVFDAPREVVFRALTDPELVPNWWGPRSLATQVDQMDVRPGGRWRFVHHDADGNEYGFHGVYHDVAGPGRVVQTFEFEGAPGHVALETLTLEEVDGKTRYMTQAVHESVEARDAIVQSGMQEGARETLDRIAELLERIQSRAS